MTATPTWTGDLIEEESVTLYPTDTEGKTRKVVVRKRFIELTKGPLTMTFKVAKGLNGHPVITDAREARTGAAPLTLKGPLPGEQYCKAGPTRKLTIVAFAREHEAKLGKEGMDALFLKIARSFGVIGKN